MRRDMIAESRKAWQKFDEEFKTLESKTINKSEQDGDKKDEEASGKKSQVSPMTLVRFPSLLGDDKKLDDHIIRVSYSLHEMVIFFVYVLKTAKPLQASREPINIRRVNTSIHFSLKVKDDEKQFEITMDTSQYKPDELKVNVTQNTLTVEAKHTEQSEDGRSFVSKQFLRRYTLPRDCKYDLVSSNLSADGILVISAPKQTSAAIQESGRNVPILRA